MFNDSFYLVQIEFECDYLIVLNLAVMMDDSWRFIVLLISSMPELCLKLIENANM